MVLDSNAVADIVAVDPGAVSDVAVTGPVVVADLNDCVVAVVGVTLCLKIRDNKIGVSMYLG